MTDLDDRNHLKDWRIFADLTQEQLGQRLGITGAQVSRIETGQRDCDTRFLKQFRTVINQRLEENMEGSFGTNVRIGHFCDAITVKPDPEALVLFNADLQRRWAELVQDIAESSIALRQPVRAKLPTGAK